MPWVAAAAALGSAVIGSEQARAQRSDANRAYRNALSSLAGVYVPTVEEQQLALQRPELVGQYEGIMEQSPEQLATEMAGLSTDPRLAQAQMDALSYLSQQGQEGMTAVDRAAFDQMQRSVAQQEQARQNAILQNMAQRGVGGSGMELAARLQSSQSAADRGQQEAIQLAAQAQQARMQALTQAGALGGQVRSQEFGEKSDIAKAKDVMGQFNLQNQLTTRRANIEEQRRAQAANLAERQRIAEAQAATANQQQASNKGLIQQRFENELARATGQADLGSARSKQLGEGAGAVGESYQQIGTGIGSVFGELAKSPTATKTAPQPSVPTASMTGFYSSDSPADDPNATYYGKYR